MDEIIEIIDVDGRRVRVSALYMLEFLGRHFLWTRNYERVATTYPTENGVRKWVELQKTDESGGEDDVEFEDEE